jgi:hypothetical protein
MGVQKSTCQTVGKIFHVGIQCPLYPTTGFSHLTSGSKHFEQKAGQIWLVGVYGLFLNTGWPDITLGCPQYLDGQYVRDFRCNILPRVQLQTCCCVCPLMDSHVHYLILSMSLILVKSHTWQRDVVFSLLPQLQLHVRPVVKPVIWWTAKGRTCHFIFSLMYSLTYMRPYIRFNK